MEYSHIAAQECNFLLFIYNHLQNCLGLAEIILFACWHVLYQWIMGTNLEWHTKDKEHEKLHREIHLNLNSSSLKGQNCVISIPGE